MPAMKIYLVGGAVRDQLLGRRVTERDYVVVGGTPEQMLARGYRPVGKDFPVFLHPRTGEQYALARTERKSGRGYYGFETRFAPDVTLEEDLARRDLTINAMALDEDGVSLIDPYGGRRDLAERVLRHVSAAFVEDPLRVLRVARFAARFATLGFRVAPETLQLMREIVASGELADLAPERIWVETERALGEVSPTEYFEVLRACGALAALLPEVEALFGVPQPELWHPEIDTGRHAMESLSVAAGLSPDTSVRFAALVHDVGKGLTPAEQWPRHIGHEEAGVQLIEALSRRLRVPNEHRELAILAARHHGRVHRALELRPATILDLLEETDAFRRPERFEQLLLCCEADARGRGPERRDQPYPQAARLRRALAAAAGLRLSAADVAGLDGPDIARRLREARLDAIRALEGEPPA